MGAAATIGESWTAFAKTTDASLTFLFVCFIVTFARNFLSSASITVKISAKVC